ncbi:MAG: allantoate amidohydrolase [Bifidobacteriaceae bacterium]|jgi:N-carbamoyl-L-amino-acid hydrolase|nr:allantoate amidohydrolase [Bifidobacteriaceae bacterium]
MTGAVELLGEIADIGRDPVGGGYSRHVFTPPESALRAWFCERARGLGLTVAPDANSNLWAWWGAPGPGAVLTGSHLDSVPGGGAFDGPLGVASALAVVARWRAAGQAPATPFAVVVFAEEEGGRFPLACLGSRLASGAVRGPDAAALADVEGVTFGEAAAAAGFPPAAFGRVPWLAEAAGYVELHIEQGMGLAELGAPVGIGRSIMAHGRWRLDFQGRADHAGATRMADRADPVVALAAGIMAAQLEARRSGGPAGGRSGGRATVGRLAVFPGGTNVIAARAAGWLDARAADAATLANLVGAIEAAARAAAAANGCAFESTAESYSPAVVFDKDLAARMGVRLAGAPRLDTGAGHDAGVIAALIPTGMLFVRNPDGASHTPRESCADADVQAGVAALDAVLTDLAGVR